MPTVASMEGQPLIGIQGPCYLAKYLAKLRQRWLSAARRDEQTSGAKYSDIAIPEPAESRRPAVFQEERGSLEPRAPGRLSVDQDARQFLVSRHLQGTVFARRLVSGRDLGHRILSLTKLGLEYVAAGVERTHRKSPVGSERLFGDERAEEFDGVAVGAALFCQRVMDDDPTYAALD